MLTAVESTRTPLPLIEATDVPASNAVPAPVSATSTVDAARARARGRAEESCDGRRRGHDQERPRHGLGGGLGAGLHRHVAEVGLRIGRDGDVGPADVGDVTVSPLTVTPSPKPATLVPAAKCVSAAEIVTLRRVPAATADGVTERTVGPAGGADHLDCADALRRLDRAVAAVGGDRHVAEPGRGVRRHREPHDHARRRQDVHRGDRHPAPGDGDGAPGPEARARPVSSTSSAAPCGTAAGSTAATVGRTAEMPRLASVSE